ncbi:tRNA nucleotidyltransferase/poly(A) polymerase (PcnB) [Eupransor demetentiae]|uniref:CCA-adding enzyme n=1 Tax=Eupransor demetentiae TaxID=3109584 RepID=A0ABP0ENI8_9LACO|nr:tRNA nucleotidyltransferase/poly(A) polymerase (PcnB) [Lactobacillaceae bacterium LMG 33000]
MKLDHFPPELEEARPILKKLDDAGYEAYFVGGSVRDTFLGDPIHDVDIASSAYPQEVKEVFKKTVDTGIQHGTVMVLDHHIGYEITTFRTESTYTDFRRPDKVTFVRSLEEDLKRRDFTINALALRQNGEVVDLFNGLGDLKAAIVRAVGDPVRRFTEDALRIMRAVRFASQLDFTIEEQTQLALKELGHNLAKIAVERNRVEFEKLLQGQAAAKGLSLTFEANLLPYLPGKMDEWPAANWQKIQAELDGGRAKTEMAAWGILTILSPMADNEIEPFLRQWKHSKQIMQTLAAIAPVLRQHAALNKWNLYRLYAYKEDLLALTDLIYGSDSDFKKQMLTIFAELSIHDRSEIALNGGDLIKAGLAKPGPALGELIHQIELAVVNDQVGNDADAIKNWIQEGHHAND